MGTTKSTKITTRSNMKNAVALERMDEQIEAMLIDLIFATLTQDEHYLLKHGYESALHRIKSDALYALQAGFDLRFIAMKMEKQLISFKYEIKPYAPPRRKM
jgi:hypothetical protein